jgi:hypothetical protein
MEIEIENGVVKAIPETKEDLKIIISALRHSKNKDVVSFGIPKDKSKKDKEKLSKDRSMWMKKAWRQRIKNLAEKLKKDHINIRVVGEETPESFSENISL